MAISKQVRKKMEDIIYDTFKAMDVSGENAERYKAKFKKMSDAQFDKYFMNMYTDKNAFLTLDIVDYERELSMQMVEDAAKVLDVPLYEYVAQPFVNGDAENPTISKFKVPVGYVHIKRVQQTAAKKNTMSTEISERSAMTGQVVNKDKNARESDIENFALLAIDAGAVIEEFMGPRADDMVMKQEMYSDIAQKGFTSLATLTNDTKNKTTLNTVDVMFLSMGIKTDLITEGLILKNTLE